MDTLATDIAVVFSSAEPLARIITAVGDADPVALEPGRLF
jgi:hypothetical protein